jgi:hypothetical protein
MCLSVLQNKKKRVTVASSLFVLKVNNCNNVNSNKVDQKLDKKHGSYERVLQRKRCIKTTP